MRGTGSHTPSQGGGMGTVRVDSTCGGLLVCHPRAPHYCPRGPWPVARGNGTNRRGGALHNCIQSCLSRQKDAPAAFAAPPCRCPVPAPPPVPLSAFQELLASGGAIPPTALAHPKPESLQPTPGVC